MITRLPVAILAYPGSLDSAVLGLQDIIGHANGISDTVLDLAVLNTFQPHPERYAALILPPSAGPVFAEEVPQISDFLVGQHRTGAVVCSACTGLAFIAEADLTGGRLVTTHWGLAQHLRAAYPGLQLDTDQLLIEYSDLVTAGGLMAWVDLALALIERFQGHDVALETARHFIVEFRRRDQRRFHRFLPELRHGDQAVLKAQHHLEARYREPLTVRRMAEVSGLPGRSFQRRFKAATGLSPQVYLQEIRIERARELLIETKTSVSEICYAVGYNDPPSFIRLFGRLTGLTPRAFREQFRRKSAR